MRISASICLDSPVEDKSTTLFTRFEKSFMMLKGEGATFDGTSSEDHPRPVFLSEQSVRRLPAPFQEESPSGWKPWREAA